MTGPRRWLRRWLPVRRVATELVVRIPVTDALLDRGDPVALADGMARLSSDAVRGWVADEVEARRGALAPERRARILRGA